MHAVEMNRKSRWTPQRPSEDRHAHGRARLVDTRVQTPRLAYAGSACGRAAPQCARHAIWQVWLATYLAVAL